MADDYRENRTESDRRDRGGSSGRPYSKGYGRRDDRSSGRGYRSDRPRDGYRGPRRDGGKPDYRSKDREDRPPRRDGDGYRGQKKDGGYKPRRDEDRPPRRDGDYRRDDDRGSRDRPPRRDGDRGDGYRDRDSNGPRRDYDRGERRPRKDGGYRRDGDRPPKRNNGYRSDKPRRDYDRREGGFRGRRDDRDFDERARFDGPLKVTIPSDPQKILFKGIDCEVNDREDLALTLYLHGGAAGSGGCEENAERILRDKTAEEAAELRGRISEICSEDALIEYDYVRLLIDPSADRTVLDKAYSEGNSLAIYCRIRLDEIAGDDPVIDVFAKDADKHPDRVTKGLDRLKRRHDSKKAEELLDVIEERRRQKQSINQTFAKAMRNDAKAIAKLDDLADDFPEAEFLAGYIESDDPEDYIRKGMADNRDLIISVASNLHLDTAFGKYLAAMKAKGDGEDWIPAMINAAKAGSSEAESELGSVKNRTDVAKALAEIRLAKGDIVALARMYDGEDADYLDRYCSGDLERILVTGRALGGDRELDWLKRCYRNGEEGCRDAIVSMASDEDRWSKRLVYSLHDVGADMEAAKLYFAMEGDPTLPSPKWLMKVCGDEEVKAYVRSVYEEKGNPEGFEAIFEEDGYEDRKRSKPRNGGRPNRGGSRGGYRR